MPPAMVSTRLAAVGHASDGAAEVAGHAARRRARRRRSRRCARSRSATRRSPAPTLPGRAPSAPGSAAPGRARRPGWRPKASARPRPPASARLRRAFATASTLGVERAARRAAPRRRSSRTLALQRAARGLRRAARSATAAPHSSDQASMRARVDRLDRDQVAGVGDRRAGDRIGAAPRARSRRAPSTREGLARRARRRRSPPPRRRRSRGRRCAARRSARAACRRSARASARRRSRAWRGTAVCPRWRGSARRSVARWVVEQALGGDRGGVEPLLGGGPQVRESERLWRNSATPIADRRDAAHRVEQPREQRAHQAPRASSGMSTLRALAGRERRRSRCASGSFSFQTRSVWRPGGTPVISNSPEAVASANQGDGDTKIVAAHRLVDRAVDLHHARVREGDAARLAGRIQAEVEVVRLREREDVVEDRVVVRHLDRLPDARSPGSRA